MFGTNVICSHMLGTETKQVRFPRSKSKRIRRKWAKDRRNWTTTYKRAMYRIGNDIYCDPDTYAELMWKMCR